MSMRTSHVDKVRHRYETIINQTNHNPGHEMLEVSAQQFAFYLLHIVTTSSKNHTKSHVQQNESM